MTDAQIEEDPSKYPGFLGEGYPEVFTTMPAQPKEKKIGQIPLEKVKEFFEQGFTVVENFFTPEEIKPCKESYRQLVDNIAQKLLKTGRIKNLYEDYGLENRLIMLEIEWPGAVMMLLKLGKLTPAFRALCQSEKLLNAIEQFLGPEIAISPVWNTRPKTPSHQETHVPWHQDAAYFDHDGHKTLIATAWVAMVDATEQNGCMQFDKGGHKKGMVAVHTCSDNFYLVLEEQEMVNRLGADPEKDFVLAPVKAGGVVFFSNMIPHRSVPNRSNHIRWAMDLRYQNPHQPFGFYGIKRGILLRSPNQPDLKPDWDFFDTQDRYAASRESQTEETDDDFDTIITAPHMKMWKLVGHNRHIEKFLQDEEQKAHVAH